MKKIARFLLVVGSLSALLLGSAMGALTVNGTSQTSEGYTITKADTYTISGKSDKPIVIAESVTGDVILNLNEVNINTTSDYALSNPGQYGSGAANLTLNISGANSFIATGTNGTQSKGAGIYSQGCVHIVGVGNGSNNKLTAQGSDSGIYIYPNGYGSIQNKISGNVSVTATGKNYGIYVMDSNADAPALTISNGAKVTATAGNISDSYGIAVYNTGGYPIDLLVDAVLEAFGGDYGICSGNWAFHLGVNGAIHAKSEYCCLFSDDSPNKVAEAADANRNPITVVSGTYKDKTNSPDPYSYLYNGNFLAELYASGKAGLLKKHFGITDPTPPPTTPPPTTTPTDDPPRTTYHTLTVTTAGAGDVFPNGGEDAEIQVIDGKNMTFTVKSGDVDCVLFEGEEIEVIDGKFTLEDISDDCEVEIVFADAQPTEPEPEPTAYTDVQAGDYAYDAIQFVTQAGLMNGYEDGSFRAETDLTRAMITTVLFRLSGEIPVNYLMTFTDVPQDAWYSEAVRWAASTRIVEGYENNVFAGDQCVTRAELCALVARYAMFVDDSITLPTDPDTTPFADGTSLADWAAAPMVWAYENGILSTTGMGHLDPATPATRAEVALALDALVNRVLCDK